MAKVFLSYVREDLAKARSIADSLEGAGHWPDFCSEPDLPYDCKAEAAKLG